MHQSIRALIALTASLGCACAAPPQAIAARDDSGTERVAQAIAHFNDAVARHDFEAMSGAFTEDAIWEASAGALGFRHQGRAAIRAWLTQNPARVEVLFYLAGPPAIELRPPARARARSRMMELLRSLDTGEVRQLFGVYTDELTEEAGRFRFTHRSFQLQHEARLDDPGR